MPNPSELERLRQEALDERIDPKEPILIVMRRGSLESRLEIDPLLFDLSRDPVSLIAAPAAAFIKEMKRG
jgi:hypothetical protein